LGLNFEQSSMKAKWFLLGALCLLQVGDLLSTQLSCARGNVELNPIVRASGLWEAKLLALILIFLLVWRSKRLCGLWFLTAGYALIVGWNFCMAATR
jgi:hypothetical protein